MDEFLSWVFGFFALMVMLGYAIQGIAWLVASLWWVIVPVLLLVMAMLIAGWIYNSPSAKAKRELKAVIKHGNQMIDDIEFATEKTKAAMERIARDWNKQR
ncbi:hypothetical protein NLX83_01825 [Allokutzneria sp. A3M-2-11 16]|uniref:hypothetical protein n=1 Tax=Allokutzneria sp. A3M-2-11 16 TaxID=2962043 RepID=UPI0020B7A7DC|nr:hypothetical protein [Allokutzneria sp. A3M-2-11 16]MCP3797988.1 hypothetical protein [Allokutzneria sp. A3M-2-11 16]